MPERAERKAVAVIAARGGSKALPGKNLAELCGKPLIAWTIEAARGAASVDRVVVTTDDPQIADVARQFGAETPFMRPARLAADDTPSTEAIIHAVEWLADQERYEPGIIINLQPTSPLRNAADVDAALALLTDRDADSVVSVGPADPHPYWAKRIDADGWMAPLIDTGLATSRRQELPAAFMLNGAIYIARRELLLSTRGWYSSRTAAYVMPAERSIDIDTAIDLTLAAAVARLHEPD